MGSKLHKQPEKKIPELMTLQEACSFLKVHPNTLRNWDENKVLPAIRIGTKKMRRYRATDIENFIKTKK